METNTIEIEPITWLLRQGHQVIKTQSSYWYDAAPKVYQAFPYHKLIVPTIDEVSDLFARSKAIAIRYSTTINQPEGLISYHVMNTKISHDVSDLPKKVRHNVSMGLHYASYRPITMNCLDKEGWYLRKETLLRQGRERAESPEFWHKLCSSAEGLSCFEAWGAFHESTLVASLFACTIEDTVCVLFQQSLSEHMKYGINNALFYRFSNMVLDRPGVKQVFYGLHSLDAPASVDQFKFRMGYSASPVRQRVMFNPVYSVLAQPISYTFLRMLKKILPSSYPVAKGEGMLRFYLQGKRQLSRQEWPEVLLGQKENIFSLASTL
jgi:hypothetical protein